MQTFGRIWEVQSIPEQRYLTNEEKPFESHFAATHLHDQPGRYIVRLPSRP